MNTSMLESSAKLFVVFSLSLSFIHWIVRLLVCSWSYFRTSAWSLTNKNFISHYPFSLFVFFTLTHTLNWLTFSFPFHVTSFGHLIAIRSLTDGTAHISTCSGILHFVFLVVIFIITVLYIMNADNRPTASDFTIGINFKSRWYQRRRRCLFWVSH